jgi:hypothetical protein
VSAGTLAVAAAPVVWAAGTASAATIPVGNVTVVNAVSGFSSNNKTLPANCPAGTKVVGGGAEIAGSAHVVLTELIPTASSYTATAVEDQVGESGQWQLLTYAYCASGNLPGYQIVSNSTTGSGAFQNVVSTCAAGNSATGSGGKIVGGGGQVDLQTLGEGSSISNLRR